MSKCSSCNRDLKSSEIPAFFDGLCKECWNKKQLETYPFKKGILEKDQEISALKKALELACEQIWAMSIWENEKDDVIEDNYKFFLNKAREVLKNE